MGQLEGQRCSDAYSSGQGLDVRQTCLGNDGRVCASTGCRPAGCTVETARVRSEENQRCTLTDTLRKIMKARQKHLDKMWVLGSLCMFWSKR